METPLYAAWYRLAGMRKSCFYAGLYGAGYAQHVIWLLDAELSTYSTAKLAKYNRLEVI